VRLKNASHGRLVGGGKNNLQARPVFLNETLTDPIRFGSRLGSAFRQTYLTNVDFIRRQIATKNLRLISNKQYFCD